MNRKEAVFHGGLAVFVVAGVLGGNCLLLSRFESQSTRQPVSVDGSPALGDAWLPSEADSVSDRFLPLSTEPAVESPAKPGHVPQPLTPAPDARPLNSGPAQDPGAAGALIEHELRDAPSDEREIWSDELRDLPPAMVRDILRVRKQQQPTQPD